MQQISQGNSQQWNYSSSPLTAQLTRVFKIRQNMLNRDTVMYEQGIITNRRLKNSKGKLSKNSFDKIETDY